MNQRVSSGPTRAWNPSAFCGCRLMNGGRDLCKLWPLTGVPDRDGQALIESDRAVRLTDSGAAQSCS